VKGWSVVDWMVAARGDDFRLFLSDMRGGVDMEKSLFARFAVDSWPALNAQWAAWVLATY
jgi:hypothetical protein